MSKVSMTPIQMAERLAGWFPPAPTPSLWEDYRLERVAPKAGSVFRELLSLTLFWMRSAMEAHYPGIAEVLVWPRVLALLHDQWGPVYQMAESEWEVFQAELPSRMAAYERVKAEGGSAVSVSTEAGAHLESNWVVRAEEQGALLALILDLVSAEGIGALFEEIELVAPS